MSLSDEYAIYLRKSRADLEAEQHGEGETLARHEKALIELARRQGLNITQIYRELVSGETIAARPVMQLLLTEVEQGQWAGVLVMEVERLARGDTMDQGLVAQTFKYSDTKIVTPIKTYDPNNEFDEEYFEFGLFMSRREYKSINRRLQRGRRASAKEGKFVGSIAPFGYERVRLENDKGFTLKIIPEQAEIVKLIFSLYCYGIDNEDGGKSRLGLQQLARRLNEMHVPPVRYDYWQKATIRDMLINPTYAGKIRWGWRPVKKKMNAGIQQKERPRNFNEDCILAEGLHEAIIDEATFNLAQEYLSSVPLPPVGYKKELQNPLAGLLYCGKCGRSMVYRKRYEPNKPPYIQCHARACDNVSAPFPLVEKRVLSALEQWLDGYKLELENQEKKSNAGADALQRSLENIEKDIARLNKQSEAAYDFLEQGIYTTDEFLTRTKRLAERLREAQKDYDAIKKELGLSAAREESRSAIIPKIEHLITTYHQLEKPAQKNELLKEVLEKAVYTKEVNGSFRGASADDFEIVLYPKLPHDK